MWSALLLVCLARLAQSSAAPEIGLHCADAVCAGNATCFIKLSSGEPVCIGRTKVGTCPFTQLAGCDEVQMTCMSDDDCPGSKICCQKDCERVCMEPGEDVPKPGHCPSRFAFGPCVHECGQDGECPGSTKCCSTGCGKICSSPYLAKPGSCPVPSLGRGTSCSIECSIDDQCPGEHKCCSTGCGRACVPPSGEHICPRGTTFYNKCNKCTCSDVHEPVSCESNICAREKPGYCPARSDHPLLKQTGCGVRCYDDEDCEGEDKCCDVTGCGNICTPAAKQRPGICPVAEGNDPCGEWCEVDSDCPGAGKCCQTGCGKICKAADEPGFCPAQLETPNCFFRDDQCVSSSDCGGGQKCCDTPCGRKCTKPVGEKPMLCPNKDKLTLKSGHFCDSDHECPHELKCCKNSQGDKGCTQPTEYRTTCRNIKCKRGFYCVDSEKGPECINKPKTTCAETVCDDDASCLQKQDKAVCVPHTKVGHCPLIATALRPCKRARVLCETDDDCAGGDICCTAGCVRRCVTPLRTDCASVGASLCRTAGYVCQDTANGAVCVEDIYTCDHKRCPAGYVCHESFTGARCVKERQTCETKICAPDEDCYEEEDGAICIQAYVAEGSINQEVKAGKCPPIRPGSYRGDCQDLCKYDSECPKQQRCCNVGCANVCLDPVFRKTCDDFDFQCPEGYACIDDPEKIKDAYCVNTTNKVGRCPAPELWSPSSRSCDQECSYDFQCQADERCCYNGCALVCVAPDLRKRCEDHNCAEGFTCVDDGVTDAKCISTAPRDGRCPRWTPGQYKKCGEDECQYDEQCPDGEKCCNNGCANVCVGADTRKLCSDIECPTGTACIENPTGDAQCFDTAEKDGLCPRVSNDTQPRGGCQDTCKYDSQCDDNSKCCFNGCAYVCLRPRKPDCDQIKCKVGYKCTEDRSGNPICSPIPCKQDGEIIDIECNSCTCIQGYLLCSQEECPPVKPGFCPKITKGYKGKCVEDCDSDYNCDGEHKCCSTGCGHTCQKPVSEIVHPCKTVRFRCGDATRCAATRGLCQPGKTCPLSPLCVSTRAPFCESCPPGKVCVLQKRSCPNGGSCHRQPICIQLYSDDTIFEEDEELEQVVVAKQTAGRKTG
ncbi:balbiani ring protein 3-like isoform X2 [Amphibalanus amphitrite]|uniref:balbiani ring protein 3-like isoform X2 n=1 Tax=Amphibalanus amphitrite TaxID=1232801 RepID=UPI001C9183C8|nr:balbiani ring protein 3-like isoform X2 [Amphibalanus amphitrite]